MTNSPTPDPADLALEHALDALARAEADAAPAGFEQRIADATAPLLRAGAPAPLPFTQTIHTPGSRRASHVRLRWAIAAGLGATACVTAWLAMRGPTTTTQQPIALEPTTTISDPQAELDAMLLASSLFTTDLDQEIESIATSAATLGLALTDPLSNAGDAAWGSALEGEPL